MKKIVFNGQENIIKFDDIDITDMDGQCILFRPTNKRFYTKIIIKNDPLSVVSVGKRCSMGLAVIYDSPNIHDAIAKCTDGMTKRDGTFYLCTLKEALETLLSDVMNQE